VQASVHAVKVVRIPAHTETVFERIVQGEVSLDALLMFNPDEQLLQSDSLTISTSLVQQPTDG